MKKLAFLSALLLTAQNHAYAQSELLQAGTHGLLKLMEVTGFNTKAAPIFFKVEETAFEMISHGPVKVVFLKKGCAGLPGKHDEEDPVFYNPIDCWGIVAQQVVLKSRMTGKTETVDALLFKNIYGGKCELDPVNLESGSCIAIEKSWTETHANALAGASASQFHSLNAAAGYQIDLYKMTKDPAFLGMKDVLLAGFTVYSNGVPGHRTHYDVFPGYAWGFGLFMDSRFSHIRNP